MCNPSLNFSIRELTEVIRQQGDKVYKVYKVLISVRIGNASDGDVQLLQYREVSVEII